MGIKIKHIRKLEEITITKPGLIKSSNDIIIVATIDYCYSFFWLCFFNQKGVKFYKEKSIWRKTEDGSVASYAISNVLDDALSKYIFESKIKG